MIRKSSFLVAIAIGALNPLAALGGANTIAPTKSGSSQSGITANTLKPAACNGITVAALSGVSGSAAADLLLATANADTISAGNGNDCILGGAGVDNINCGTGTDVAIGGPGTDIFNVNCETQIQ